VPPGQPLVLQQPQQPLAGLQPPGQLFAQQQPVPLVDQLKALIQQNPPLLALVQKNPGLVDLFAQYPLLLGMLQQEMLFQREIGQKFEQAQLDDFLARYKKQNPDFAGLTPTTTPSQSTASLLQKIGQ